MAGVKRRYPPDQTDNEDTCWEKHDALIRSLYKSNPIQEVKRIVEQEADWPREFT